MGICNKKKRITLVLLFVPPQGLDCATCSRQSCAHLVYTLPTSLRGRRLQGSRSLSGLERLKAVTEGVPQSPLVVVRRYTTEVTLPKFESAEGKILFVWWQTAKGGCDIGGNVGSLLIKHQPPISHRS